MRKETEIATFENNMNSCSYILAVLKSLLPFYYSKGLTLWRKWILKSDVRAQTALLSDYSRL